MEASIARVNLGSASVGAPFTLSNELVPAYPGAALVAKARSAVARVVDGFVVAYSKEVTAFPYNDGAVAVLFVNDAAASTLLASTTKKVLVPLGPIDQLSIAPMSDGSVVVATTPYSNNPTMTIALTRVRADGSTTTLSPQTVDPPFAIGGGVVLRPLDDGFVVGYQQLTLDQTVAGGIADSTVRIVPYGSDGAPLASAFSIGRGVYVDSPFALDTSPFDRTIHFVYLRQWPPVALDYGRLYCKRG
ncbi:MAG: hypothetical protein ACHREM_03440 [Polyangiales bacterium]